MKILLRDFNLKYHIGSPGCAFRDVSTNTVNENLWLTVKTNKWDSWSMIHQ